MLFRHLVNILTGWSGAEPDRPSALCNPDILARNHCAIGDWMRTPAEHCRLNWLVEGDDCHFAPPFQIGPRDSRNRYIGVPSGIMRRTPSRRIHSQSCKLPSAKYHAEQWPENFPVTLWRAKLPLANIPPLKVTFWIFICVGVCLGVVEGKAEWRENYRKRSCLIEGARVERKVESAER